MANTDMPTLQRDPGQVGRILKVTGCPYRQGESGGRDANAAYLEQAPGITPAQLPTAGLLDQLKASHELDDLTLTAVGYGTVREDKTGGPHSLFFDGVRRYALQSALNLEKA